MQYLYSLITTKKHKKYVINQIFEEKNIRIIKFEINYIYFN